MTNLKEEFLKVNDYTISVMQEMCEPDDNRVIRKRTVTRTFNFLSARMSESFDTCLYEARGSTAGSTAVSSNVFIENFKNLPSHEEIKLMHAKLIEIGGTPPSLEKVLGKMEKPKHNHPTLS